MGYILPGAQLALKNLATAEYWSPPAQLIMLASSSVPTGIIHPDDFCTPVWQDLAPCQDRKRLMCKLY